MGGKYSSTMPAYLWPSEVSSMLVFTKLFCGQ
jgi:hypothetical protein